MKSLYWRWKQNFAKPGVFPGNFIVFRGMAANHKPLQEFALSFIELPQKGKILDIGCGGGQFIAEMAARAPEASFQGLDHSPLSVKQTARTNRALVREKRLRITVGSVSDLPFPENSFDLATASETVYFWPDLKKDFRQVLNVLKPDGVFMICCDSSDKEAGKKYTDHIPGMTVYTAEEFTALLTEAGFCKVEAHLRPDGAVCMTARKPGTPDR